MREAVASGAVTHLQAAWEAFEPWAMTTIERIDRIQYLPLVIVGVVVMFMVAMVHGACAHNPGREGTLSRRLNVVVRLSLSVAAATLLVLWAFFALSADP